MSRIQFIVLNTVGGICSVLIAGAIVLSQLNGHLNLSVVETRSQFGETQQVQSTVQNLVGRIAQAGQTDPALRDLLTRHGFKINLNTNSPTRTSP
jgi:hypothetical protein